MLRDSELLVVYPPEGDLYEVALPCQAHKVWALGKEGLLIQRQLAGWEMDGLGMEEGEVEKEEEGEAAVLMLGEDEEGGQGRMRMVMEEGGGGGGRRIGQEEGMVALSLRPEPIPSLFSLRHPLEELKPVAMVEGGREGGRKMGSEGEKEEHPVLLCDAQERVIFTEEIGLPCGEGGKEGGREGGEGAAMVVTYNDRNGQHRVWLAHPTSTGEEKEEGEEDEGEGEEEGWGEGGREGGMEEGEEEEEEGEEKDLSRASTATQASFPIGGSGGGAKMRDSLRRESGEGGKSRTSLRRRRRSSLTGSVGSAGRRRSSLGVGGREGGMEGGRLLLDDSSQYHAASMHQSR